MQNQRYYSYVPSNRKFLLATVMILFSVVLSFAIANDNIECGCSETGVYLDPDKGDPIEVKLQTVEEAISPNGVYRLTASGGGTGTVNVVIRENNAGAAEVLNISFLETEAGWGFSPDDQRFVIHYMSSSSRHTYNLYDLRQRPARMVKEQTITLVSSGSAQLRFSPNGVYLFYSAMTGATRTYMSVVDTTGFVAYSNEYDFQTFPGSSGDKYGMARWGFSSDMQDRTLAYAYISGTNSFHLVAVNLATQTELANEDILNAVSSFWQFSPCGDMMGLMVQESQSQLRIRLLKTETGYAIFNNTFALGSVEFRSTEQSQIVRVDNQDYILAPNAAISACTDLEPPTWPDSSQVNSSDLSENGVVLTWNRATDASGISGYKVYQDGIGIDEVSDTTYTVSGLTPNTGYEFRIEAGDSAGNWSTSGPAVTVTTLPPADSDSPTWPQGAVLGVLSAYSSGLNLEWYAANDNVGVTAYALFKNDVPVDTFSVQPDAAFMDYRINGLELGASYTFRVEAGDNAGNWSSAGPSLSIVYDPDTPPSWPTGSTLVVDSVGITGVRLHWNPAYAPISVSRYQVYVNDNASMSVYPLDDLLPADTTALVDDLDPETTYTFRIEASNENYFWSSGGPEATARTLKDNVPPYWPQDHILSDCDIQATSVSLFWDPAYDNVWVSAYRIYRNDILIGQIDMDNGPGYSKSMRASGDYTFRADSLQPSTQYTFRVEAGDEAGNWSTGGPTLTVTTRSSGTTANLPLAGNYKSTQIMESIYSLGAQAINNSGQMTVYQNEQAFIWDNNELKPLGALSGTYAKPFTINELGQIMGESIIGPNYVAFFWEDDSMMSMTSMGGNWVMPEAMNDSGYAVGWSRYSSIYSAGWQKAFLWKRGKGMIDLGTLGGEKDMEWWETVSSSAFDINNKNQVIGVSPAPGPEDHGFFWQNDSMIDMGKIYPVDINDQGQVVGQATYSDNVGHAVLWTYSGMTDLGTGDGKSTWPVAINENRQVMGRLQLDQVDCDGYSIEHVFLWEGDRARDICPAGAKNYEPKAINNSGQIVGRYEKDDGSYHAFLWTDDAMYQLDDQGAESSVASDINDEGQIIINAVGTDGQNRILLAEASAVNIPNKGSQNLPTRFTLEQNYPNPFNPVTTISFSLPRMEHVSLKVYDLLGREVKSLVSERKAAGIYHIEFNAAGLASGIYYYHLEAGSFVSTRKLVLLK